MPQRRSQAELGQQGKRASNFLPRRKRNANSTDRPTNCVLGNLTHDLTQRPIMPEPRQHAQSRGWIESILRRIPGFKGYLEKEYRRDSDSLQRTWLADRLQRSKRSLDAYARTLVDAGKLDAVAQIDRFKGRLDKAIGRLRGAMAGYSGFFDLVQVDEASLQRVYEY